MHFEYHEANVKDAVQLSVLFQAVYIDTYGLEGASKEFSSFITKEFHPDAIIERIGSEKCKLFIATYKTNPVGILQVELDRECTINNFKSAEINKLYVLRHFHGKGIAHELMNLGEAFIKEQNEKKIWLITWEKNPKAIRFYQKEQYQIIGTSPFVMEKNTYTNMVMTKQL